MHAQTRRLYEAIAHQMGKDSVKLTDAAKFLRLKNAQTLKNWETRGPSDKGIVAAGKAGISTLWITSGTKPMLTQPTTAAVRAQEEPAQLYTTDEMVRIPLLENGGSMGGGSDALADDVVAGELTVSRRWLRTVVGISRTTSLRLIHAYGESMSPTMTNGAILLVDTAQNSPESADGVYVLRAQDHVYVKRVHRRMDGRLEVSSDNIVVKTVDVLRGNHELDVIGRVAWVWNGSPP